MILLLPMCAIYGTLTLIVEYTTIIVVACVNERYQQLSLLPRLIPSYFNPADIIQYTTSNNFNQSYFQFDPNYNYVRWQ